MIQRIINWWRYKRHGAEYWHKLYSDLLEIHTEEIKKGKIK